MIRHHNWSLWTGGLSLALLCLGANNASAQSCSCGPCQAVPNATAADPNAPAQPEPEINFDLSQQFAATTGDTVALAQSNGGYIDPALIRTTLRFRFEAGYDYEKPDRNEFLYSTGAANGGGNGSIPVALGSESSVDYQSLALYYEQKVHEYGSLFVEIPVMFTNPELNPNFRGLYDMNAGFKVGLLSDEDYQLTFQLRTYIPTGDPNKWLSTGHVSLEPAFLFWGKLTDRLMIEAEFRDWIPIDGSVNPNNGRDFAGSILRYGVGVSYKLIDTCDFTFSPVAEFVGWSLLDGQFTSASVDPNGGVVQETGFSTNDFIANFKLGARVNWGCGHSFYGGWGHAITDDRWYQDIVRVEYRKTF